MRRAPRRLILRCRLCEDDGLLIEPTSERPVHAAVDHALDHHRDELQLYPEQTLDHLSVVA